MRRTEFFLLLLVIGSLWGFVEMLPLPVFALCSFGILFLVIARQKVDIPGTSILIGLIVCFYKTYSAHFFICQWTGVMALAISFDLLTSLIFKHSWSEKQNPIYLGILTNLLALIVFLGLIIYVFEHPYWVAGGFDRAMSYAVRNTLPAALISGLLSAPLGVYAGSKIVAIDYFKQRKLVVSFYVLIISFLWIAA